MNKTSRWIFCTLIVMLVTLFAHTAVYAQGNWNRNSERAASDAKARQATQNAWLAESIVASRESAMGRSFDPVYRASLKNSLASLPTKEIESLQYAGSEGRLSIGDSSADLIYTPVTPCRVFDTRSSTAGILVGGTQRNFHIAGGGTTIFINQGGTSGGCGIPFGPATAVIINFTAVTPTAGGDLRAWAVTNPQLEAPFAAIMNYSTDMFALANGVAVPICDPGATSCGAGDLRLQADWGSVHVVGDVVGYFRKLDLPAAMPMGTKQLSSLWTTAANTDYAIGDTDIVLPHNGSCLVTCDAVGGNSLDGEGQLFIMTAQRDVAAATNHYGIDNGWAMEFPVPSQHGSGSATYTWSMTGGKTYRFGCAFGATGGCVGKKLYPQVSWICR
jgi:hypothetical protein